jgi:hypothetical protein
MVGQMPSIVFALSESFFMGLLSFRSIQL